MERGTNIGENPDRGQCEETTREDLEGSGTGPRTSETLGYIGNGVREQISENFGEELLMMDGFDEAVVGVIETFQGNLCVTYGVDKVLEILMEQGMSGAEAREYFHFNQKGAYLGPGTPLFLETV